MSIIVALVLLTAALGSPARAQPQQPAAAAQPAPAVPPEAVPQVIVEDLRGERRTEEASVAEEAQAATAPPAQPEPDPMAGRIFFGFFLGGGIGLVQGSAESAPEQHIVQSSGFAPAQLGHGAPEVGVFLGRSFVLSAQARVQAVTGANGIPGWGCGEYGGYGYCQPMRTAFAAFLRFFWVGEGETVRPLLGIAAGVGSIRHVLKFPGPYVCGPNGDRSCVDTLESGWFLVGPTLGLLFPVLDHFALALTSNIQLAIPRSSLNVDLNAGVVVSF